MVVSCWKLTKVYLHCGWAGENIFYWLYWFRTPSSMKMGLQRPIYPVDVINLTAFLEEKYLFTPSSIFSDLGPVGNMAVKHPKIKLKNSLFLYFFLGLCCDAVYPGAPFQFPGLSRITPDPASILLVSRATVLPWRDLMTATGLSSRVSCLPTRPRGACTRTRTCGQQDVIFLNDKIRRRHTRVVADT